MRLRYLSWIRQTSEFHTQEVKASMSHMIRSHRVSCCAVCGSPGNTIYSNLNDRLFSAPGLWGNKKCKNHVCGLIWLDPAPVREDIHLAYLKYYTHTSPTVIDDAKPVYRPAWQGYRSIVFGSRQFPAPFRQKALGALFFLLPNRKPALEYPIRQLQNMEPGKLLEIGCGAGAMLQSVNDLGWESVGIDFDRAAVAAARAKGLDVRDGDLSAQEFPDASFDVVMMNHVIEHLPDPSEALAEIARILRPGGRLIGITPNAESWGHSHFGSDWRGLEPPRHLQIYTRHALKAALICAGLVQTEVTATVMSASQILKESLQLGSPSISINTGWARLYLEAIWLWEWLLTLMGKSAGEILLFVGEKERQ